MNLQTGEWHIAQKPDIHALRNAGKNLRTLLEDDSPEGHYARVVIVRTLAYAAFLVGDAADDPAAIDAAMCLGYNWQHGPFELIDMIGSDWLIDALKQFGDPIPPYLQTLQGKSAYLIENGKQCILAPDGNYRPLPRAEGVLLLSDIKLNSKPLTKNASAALWDIGDGILCLEITSKMGTMDPDILAVVSKALEIIPDNHKGLVIYNDTQGAQNIFSAGANLGLALFALNVAAWEQIEQLTSLGQMTFNAMRTAPFPVVCAPAGLALGGGCEILLHSDAVQAHAESYIGLVEVGVGLIPGWSGCTEMLNRWQHNPTHPKEPIAPIGKVFEIISTATVSKSAQEARELMFLRDSDGITMNRDRLLFDAKAKALALAENYTPPEPREYIPPGASGKVALSMAVHAMQQLGKATEYDGVVCNELATILTGGDTDVTETLGEDKLLELERTAFMRLLHNEKTIARCESVVLHGKPLRN